MSEKKNPAQIKAEMDRLRADAQEAEKRLRFGQRVIDNFHRLLPAAYSGVDSFEAMIKDAEAATKTEDAYMDQVRDEADMDGIRATWEILASELKGAMRLYRLSDDELSLLHKMGGDQAQAEMFWRAQAEAKGFDADTVTPCDDAHEFHAVPRP